MHPNTIKEVIMSDLCLGCGLCHVINEDTDITEKDGNLKSSFKNTASKEDHIKVCPGAGYDIEEMGKSIHQAPHFIYELGYYSSLQLVHSTDDEILKRASSGGAMTAIALYMLESGKADGIICTKYTYPNGKPRQTTYVARTKAELLEAQGSKYCPTSTLSILTELKEGERYVLIGTPCQIAGWRKYAKYYSITFEIVLTIANFCGGYRDYREMDYFVKEVAGFNTVTHFQHRGDGVPGQMRIVNEEGKEWSYPYPEYAKLSPIQKNNRCVYCIDATGELADFSCGDAWLDRVKTTNQVWSTIIARNEKAEAILAQIKTGGYIEVGEISQDEVILSQKLNITSKKYRQYKRMKVSSWMLRTIPNWHHKVYDVSGNYFSEIKILVSKFLDKHIRKK